MTRWIFVLCAVALGGCGGAAQDYPDMDTPLPAEPKAKRQPAPAKRPHDALYRDEVDTVVDAGLGAFLRHIELEPAIEQGSFRGFRIVALYPPEFWQGVDLNPGDVVTRVNGMPIERPPEAFEAFQSLKSRDHLVVDLERAGKPRRLTYRIVARAGRSAPVKAQPGPSEKSDPVAN